MADKWYPFPPRTDIYDRADPVTLNDPEGSEPSLVATMTRVRLDPDDPTRTSLPPIVILLGRLAEDPEMLAAMGAEVSQSTATAMIKLAWERRTFPSV